MADETTVDTSVDNVDYKSMYEEMKAEYSKVKVSLDRASSEVADYKRKERDRMTEDEKKTLEAEEREKYYKELERKLAISEYANELDDIKDEKVKTQIVELLVDGKIVDALKMHKDFRAKDRVEIEKDIKAELMKQNPQSAASSGKPAKTKDEIMAIQDTAARQKAIAENLNLFQ